MIILRNKKFSEKKESWKNKIKKAGNKLIEIGKEAGSYRNLSSDYDDTTQLHNQLAMQLHRDAVNMHSMAAMGHPIM